MFSQEFARFIYRGLRVGDEAPFMSDCLSQLRDISSALKRTRFGSALGNGMMRAIAGAQTHAGLMNLLTDAGYQIVVPKLSDKAECVQWDWNIGCDFAAYKQEKLYLIDTKNALFDAEQADKSFLEVASVVEVTRGKYNMRLVLSVRHDILKLLKAPDETHMNHLIVTVPSVGIIKGSIATIEPTAASDILRQLNSIKGKTYAADN